MEVFMKKLFTMAVFIFSLSAIASSQWRITLATQDDTPNGPGHQVASAGAVNDNIFVALVNRPVGIVYPPFDDVNITKDSAACTYLVGYKNATDLTGRLGVYPYGSGGTAGLYSKWFSGFDEVYLFRAFKIITTSDSLVYVANNDPDHNILVFKVTGDTIVTTDYRMKTGSNDIQGLAIDDNGNVYVSEITGAAPKVKVFKGIKAAGNTWATDHNDAPLTTISLPQGVYRGLTVNGPGSSIFISSMSDRNVVKYSGTPAAGYSKNAGFKFSLTAVDTIPGTYDATLDAWDLAKPLGMAYLKGNNLLFVTAARWWGNTIKTHNSTSAYTYSKLFVLNPASGARIDSLDVAKYYFDSTGGYSTQSFSPGVSASGYASMYDVAFDNNKDMYIQSFYSWTVERWHFDGTLPTTTTVQREGNSTPSQFTLGQNYPNPFNPSTKIEFSLTKTTNVSLKIFDVLGKEVATLVNGELQQGTYTSTFDASKLSTGVYLYTLRAGEFVQTKKMLMTK
jgi:hypothetical protein